MWEGKGEEELSQSQRQPESPQEEEDDALDDQENDDFGDDFDEFAEEGDDFGEFDEADETPLASAPHQPAASQPPPPDILGDLVSRLVNKPSIPLTR